MGEKRKSHTGEASSKKSKSLKKANSKSAPVSSETRHISIPYPEPVDGSSFTECTSKLTVTLAPVHSRDLWAGIHETLNSMLLRFVPQVRGVVLSYSRVKPLSDTALMFHDSPFGQLDVSAKLLLWRPIAGMTLRGSINVQSPDHVGLLLWDTFNASIPASFIPKNKYEWRPFSDEEISARASMAIQKADSSAADGTIDSTTQTPEQPSMAVFETNDNKFGSGEWVLKGTSESVGSSGSLEFVVVDIIRANDVLSVTGALR
ncbi:hypothetical protein IW140_000565 [Coemansia sp. RSA 1813]|nr:hypothetical protein EV178_002705 [Coemansia sp. RSA 1646]KAJ1774033.1 hypothetical protein LPJ74_000132 [Coemansia sp. RSA 1843]KAJ2092577.1 hypothetical protein IW138_001015 [Coemansia sp. RSA 986]KAJ2216729.1 hypothetical protein EV179_001019 [Coemansia sp. RSA 487]KAJ2572802.1 hypothetical protein IW140_000565 [Coemansia sp. RSA 1813]